MLDPARQLPGSFVGAQTMLGYGRLANRGPGLLSGARRGRKPARPPLPLSTLTLYPTRQSSQEGLMASITIKAADGSGSFAAYTAEPKAKPTGVVVLIQEIFGVNQAMRNTAAWVADIGFIAVCPDLFWRIEPGIDITDKSEAEWKRAFELFQTFDQAKGIEDLRATVAACRTIP